MDNNQKSAQNSGQKKDPTEWKSAGEPATDAQKKYIASLAEKAGEKVDTSKMTKAEASKKIDGYLKG